MQLRGACVTLTQLPWRVVSGTFRTLPLGLPCFVTCREREGWRWVTLDGGLNHRVTCSMEQAWVGRKFEVDVDINVVRSGWGVLFMVISFVTFGV